MRTVPCKHLKDGSPPLAWGQFCTRDARSGKVRFTPTCMGTMRRYQYHLGFLSVHPHLHGDNIDVVLGVAAHFGSPPLAWGQFPREVDRDDLAVHPHLHGDNFACSFAIKLFSGSPPLAWGQCDRRRRGARQHRFTPTCMGTILDFFTGTVPILESVHDPGAEPC